PPESTLAAFFGRPPVHSGMLPSALADFSAPSGVRLVPSLAASSADTAANTLPASRERVRALISCVVVFIGLILCGAELEVHADAERDEVAIGLGVVVAVEEVGVA